MKSLKLYIRSIFKCVSFHLFVCQLLSYNFNLDYKNSNGVGCKIVASSSTLINWT